jgi:hypothetical protein
MGKNLSKLRLADQEREGHASCAVLAYLRCGNAYPERGTVVLDVTVNKEGKTDEARQQPTKVEDQQSHLRSAHIQRV